MQAEIAETESASFRERAVTVPVFVWIGTKADAKQQNGLARDCALMGGSCVKSRMCCALLWD